MNFLIFEEHFLFFFISVFMLFDLKHVLHVGVLCQHVDDGSQGGGGVVALQLVAGDYGEAASQEKNGGESQAKDCHAFSWAADTYLSVRIGSQSVFIHACVLYYRSPAGERVFVKKEKGD
jgi:hypothetical protein